MRCARVFFIIVILFCILETVRLWFLTPDVMASHFNIQGNPDRFVPKLVFFSYEVQTVLVVIVLGLVIQILTMVLPVQWINMPNREYWLALERREATVDRISSFGFALFSTVLIVIQAGFELSVSANLQQPITFAAQLMIPIIVGFFILNFILLLWLTRSFRLPA